MKKMIPFLMSLSTIAMAQDMPPLHFSLQSGVGDTVRVQVQVPASYHLTSHKPLSEDLVPMEAQLLMAGVKLGAPIYPKPTLKEKPGLDYKLSYYQGSFILKFPILKIDPNLKKWPEAKINLDYQACTDQSCFAPKSEFAVFGAAQTGSKLKKLEQTSPDAQSAVSSAIASSSEAFSSSARLSSETLSSTTALAPVTTAPTQTPSATTAPAADQNVWKLLFFAFLGGMILNLMPCVLPVLGLKLFALVEKKGASRSFLYANAGSFTAGTLISFWIFASVMALLKNAGQSVGWGFQFQEPGFVIFMAVLVTLFALNLFGMFEVSLGSKTQTSMNKAGSKGGLGGAFFNGMFMTLLATPCTAPMLSPAMGYAFSQPTYVLYLFMSVVALGLAFPFVAFSLIPGALKFFPKPGDWMVTLKEFMGFLLLFTLPWLLYIFGSQAGFYSVSILVALLAILALMVWVYDKLPWTGLFAAQFWPKPLTILALAVLWISAYQFYLKPAMAEDALKAQNSQTVENTVWSADEVSRLNAQGKDVFVDFTAQWCVTCKANEKVALNDPKVEEIFKSGKYVKLVGDYTKPSPAILAELKKFGKSGVPMYVIYRHDGTTEVLPEILTPEIVLKALK